MKISLLATLVAAAMDLSLPALAQQQKAVDPEVRKEIEAAIAQFQGAYNKHDADALAALYTPDAVELRSWRGLLSGQESIRKMFGFDFASSGGKMSTEVLQLRPVGNAICEIAHSNVKGWKDEAVVIYNRDGDAWKRRMVYVNYNPQAKDVVDPEMRQQIEAVLVKFDEAYKQGDEIAIAALYTLDAVEARSWGGANYLCSGRQSIATQYANDFASYPNLVMKIDELYPIGDDVCAIIDRTVGTLSGQAVKIFTREADTWKIGMSYLDGPPGT
ncbi:MAG: hypothetical protein C5B58_04860 [Acidobacteria bacterium]|nr:MAG: hypothetical protein C5B58_04860 [Acidobacteriota bacterium]